MKALVVGGPCAGEWVDVPDGLAVWIDLKHGDTLPINRVTWALANADGTPGDRFSLPVATHPSMADDAAAVQNTVIGHAVTEYMRAHGILLPPPEPPAIAVPDSPAALFGADGRPLGGAR